jgi:hypothetical protein
VARTEEAAGPVNAGGRQPHSDAAQTKKGQANMTTPKQEPTAELTHDEVRRLCGDIVDWKLSAIIATGASLEEIEECVAWISGLDDVMGEERKPLTGKVAEIYDILTSDDEWGDEGLPVRP